MRRRDFFVLVGIATAARVLDANALESGKLYKTCSAKISGSRD
jgi:hypothetical protein